LNEANKSENRSNYSKLKKKVTYISSHNQGFNGLTGLYLGVCPSIALYASSIIWDAIGGINGVKKHNAEIEQKTKSSFLNTFQPTLAVATDGAFVGAQFRF